jgi:hypothetical protein
MPPRSFQLHLSHLSHLGEPTFFTSTQPTTHCDYRDIFLDMFNTIIMIGSYAARLLIPASLITLFLPKTGNVYVCGILGTTRVDDSDLWMATDFVAIRELLGAHDEMSIWLCGTPICRGSQFLLGDPACDWIVFDPPPFEQLWHEPVDLYAEYLHQVQSMGLKLRTEDILVLVSVGHGCPVDGSFEIGNDESSIRLRKERLEGILHSKKGKVFVITTACFSGSWVSTHWTLLAAAQAHQEAPSIVESGSGQFRGGFFTNALVAEHADEFNI